MLDSLYIGATGMQAQQTNVDMLANNLANVHTSAYKRGQVTFEDMMYRDVLRTASSEQAGDAIQRIGVGVAISNTGKVFTQGDVKRTDVPFDVAIMGQGFFEVTLPDGSLGYTRNGHFQVNRDGYLVTSDGYQLKTPIQIPPDAKEILIQPNGLVSVTLPNETNPVEIGQLDLTTFANPAGLTARGNNLYTANYSSGDAVSHQPGDAGLGTLQQGSLESSNVKLIEEMINLIMAQRAYEVNTKVVQASDEMLGMSNNLRR